MHLKAGLIFFAAAGGIFSLGALVAPPWASGTNAGTAISSTCGADGHWVVAMSVTSQYDGVIHIQLTDTHGPTPVMDLAPFATKTITEHPDTGSTTWMWAWASTDGHLTGPAVSGTATRPDGCTPPPTPGTTTTTTCTQAIPPRSDCAPPAEVTTSPPTTASVPAVTTTPGQPPSTTAATSPSIPSGSASSIAISAGGSARPSSNLPATGTGSTIVWVGVAVLAVGTVAILIVRRRRP